MVNIDRGISKETFGGETEQASQRFIGSKTKFIDTNPHASSNENSNAANSDSIE